MKSFFISLMLVFFLFSNVYSADMLKIDSNELLNQYSKNELAGDKKFRGKRLIVTGKIDEIAKDFDGNVYVSFDTPNPFEDIENIKEDVNPFESVVCYFEDLDGLEDLSKGQWVAIEGKCRGKDMMKVVLVDCNLVK